MTKQRLLFLCHRVPYPPDKGEKIRAWHILNRLAEQWRVDLGCLVDDPVDLEHLPLLRACCDEVEVQPVGRAGRIIRTLLNHRPGRPLTLDWFDEPRLRRWAHDGLASGRYQAVFVYSSAMAPYAMGPATGQPGLRRILDMVDIDSEKWGAYAAAARFPRRQVWAREARTLLSFERQAALDFDLTLFVSPEEEARFLSLAPEATGKTASLENGVDLAYFDPAHGYADPFHGEGPALVFTGTMDYRPNIDAVCWLAHEVMPLLAEQAPHFHIIGAKPAPAVRALEALPHVHVHGRVHDMRPYLAHADAVVAPLRIARGIQNKVLEAMAMARPVVASPEAFEGVKACAGRDLLVADGARAMAQAVREVLSGRHPGLGDSGRAAMLAGHDWRATLGPLPALLSGQRAGQPRSRATAPTTQRAETAPCQA